MGIFDIFKKNKAHTIKIEVKSETANEQKRILKTKPTLYAIKTESIVLENAISKYNLENIRFIDAKQNDSKNYIIENENCSIVENDVEYLLSVLKEFLRSNNIKLDFIIKKQINFDISNYGEGSIDFAYFKYEPLTTTGKLSKYPLQLNIYAPHDFFNVSFDAMINANIYYLKDGSIGKVRLWVWSNHSCTTFNYAIKNTKLTITKIERTSNNGYDKDVIYSYNQPGTNIKNA